MSNYQKTTVIKSNKKTLTESEIVKELTPSRKRLVAKLRLAVWTVTHCHFALISVTKTPPLVMLDCVVSLREVTREAISFKYLFLSLSLVNEQILTCILCKSGNEHLSTMLGSVISSISRPRSRCAIWPPLPLLTKK